MGLLGHDLQNQSLSFPPVALVSYRESYLIPYKIEILGIIIHGITQHQRVGQKGYPACMLIG